MPVAGGAKCAERMFLDMTTRVLRAPSSYFETTPLGRVLNRFTYDVEVLDVELSISMAGLMISSSLLISSIVVMVRPSIAYRVNTFVDKNLTLRFDIDCHKKACYFAVDCPLYCACRSRIHLHSALLSQEWPRPAKD